VQLVGAGVAQQSHGADADLQVLGDTSCLKH
jgi:hypothetical protein